MHVLLVGLLSQTKQMVPQQDSSDQKAIKARLVYLPLPAPEPIKIDTIETQANSAKQPIDLTTEVGSPQAKSQQVTETTELQIDSIVEPQTASNTKQETSASGPIATRSLTQRYTQNYMQQHTREQLNSLAEQQSSEYQQQLRSPDLELPSYLDPAEKALVKPTVVACNNTSASIIMLLGNTMGGNMRCREQPDIDEFIKNRLEKK